MVAADLQIVDSLQINRFNDKILFFTLFSRPPLSPHFSFITAQWIVVCRARSTYELFGRSFEIPTPVEFLIRDSTLCTLIVSSRSFRPPKFFSSLECHRNATNRFPTPRVFLFASRRHCLNRFEIIVRESWWVPRLWSRTEFLLSLLFFFFFYLVFPVWVFKENNKRLMNSRDFSRSIASIVDSSRFSKTAKVVS